MSSLSGILWTFLIFLLIVPTIFAQAGETAPAVAQAVQELKTVDIYFAYYSSISSNTNYTFYLNFTPVDWGSLSRMRVALIRVVEEQSGNPSLYVWVNDQSCNTPNISAKVGKSQYVADFECTNVINDTGCYSVTFQSSMSIDNAHFRAWLTYTTDLTNQTIATQKQLIEVLNYFDATAEEKLRSNHDYCVGNTTQRKILTIEKCGILFNVTTCFTTNRTEDVFCNYGCDVQQGVCKEAPYIVSLKIFGGLVVFILLLVAILKLSGRV